ncbi:hypothetical protein BDZ89DRAFT_1142711 [Hymenopellis radicata]|nr:hypothetical protein BDZ89DRAFT_1142711 [Hymenopellis radicata]
MLSSLKLDPFNIDSISPSQRFVLPSGVPVYVEQDSSGSRYLYPLNPPTPYRHRISNRLSFLDSRPSFAEAISSPTMTEDGRRRMAREFVPDISPHMSSLPPSMSSASNVTPRLTQSVSYAQPLAGPLGLQDYEDTPMGKLMREYRDGPNNNLFQFKLHPSHIVDRGPDVTDHYALQTGRFTKFQKVTNELQAFINAAVKPIPGRKMAYVVDPKGKLLRMLQGTHDIAIIFTMWLTLQRRLSSGTKTMENYEKEYINGEKPASPASTNPEVYEGVASVQSDKEAIQYLYQNIPHLHRHLNMLQRRKIRNFVNLDAVFPLAEAEEIFPLPGRRALPAVTTSQGANVSQAESSTVESTLSSAMNLTSFMKPSERRRDPFKDSSLLTGASYFGTISPDIQPELSPMLPRPLPTPTASTSQALETPLSMPRQPLLHPSLLRPRTDHNILITLSILFLHLEKDLQEVTIAVEEGVQVVMTEVEEVHRPRNQVAEVMKVTRIHIDEAQEASEGTENASTSNLRLAQIWVTSHESQVTCELPALAETCGMLYLVLTVLLVLAVLLVLKDLKDLWVPQVVMEEMEIQIKEVEEVILQVIVAEEGMMIMGIMMMMAATRKRNDVLQPTGDMYQRSRRN